MEGEGSFFGLLTELCNKTATKYSTRNKISQKLLSSKMRSHAYEIILKKSRKEINYNSKGAITDLLSYYLVFHQNVKNVAEYKKCLELKRVIGEVQQVDFGEEKDQVYNVLTLLVGLSDSLIEDHSHKLFNKPFSFGLLEQMLPKLPRAQFGSPEPYSYYPLHIFVLPYSLNQQNNPINGKQSCTFTEYTVESFDSRSLLPERTTPGGGEIKSFRSPMSLPSFSSTNLSPCRYLSSVLWNHPRLTAPRDLQIPTSGSKGCDSMKVTFADGNEEQEVFRPSSTDLEDIWDIVTQVDKDIPDDIWQIASKLPPIYERQLISTSLREMVLWRQLYENALNDLSVISEKQFIRNVMYLLIGIETTSFPFSEESNCFYMKENLVLEGISKEHIRGYMTELQLVGTYYKRLYTFAFNQGLNDHFRNNGLVFEAAREVIRQYLLHFRLKTTEIYEECTKASNEELNCMPTLLQIVNHMEPLKYEIETIVSIYKLINADPKITLPLGAELMSYLFNEISLITHRHTALTMFGALFSICKVYFQFIERFIFDGELDDRFDEFFIRKDSQYVNTRSKRYWDKGFHIIQTVAVPEFLRPLAKFILLCGKSLRLLKQCNPSDPLVLLISSDHPSVTCCASFEELERQQQVLDVYRTRCLFVSGEPVTFDQIQLKKEAERKAFTEMASLKQAETMEKIVAERKRLAQLIIAEKQHSLRVLEAAMAEAQAVKMKAKQREKHRTQLEVEAEKAAEEVDSMLKDQERNKIMEYYSKLNMEVEKSKLHAEWKIKRLQLDQSRMQLLSTEERNLKREKLELEHKRNEEIMAMSIQSTDLKSDVENETDDADKHSDVIKTNSTKSHLSRDKEKDEVSDSDLNKAKYKTAVFSAICNVAKSIFGGSKNNEDDDCDNKKELDAQGNVVPVDSENNSNETKTSSQVIGSCINDVFDNLQYLKVKGEAMKNKQKVMAHKFGHVDIENNQTIDPPLINLSVDGDNNVPGMWNATYLETKRNKMKVLGADIGSICCAKPSVSEPFTDAQREAMRNKKKVLGVEYNIPIDLGGKREPANQAQVEALRNKEKILGSEDIRPMESTPRLGPPKRSDLTLNLKPFTVENTSEFNLGVTTNTGLLTPGDLFPRLDLETPTTADIPLDGALTGEAFTPHSEGTRLDTASMKTDKEFLRGDGFDFSMIVDESVESIGDVPSVDTPDNSINKDVEFELTDKHSFINLLDGTYSLKNMDPFGVRDLKPYTKDYFSSKMDLTPSNYTHPAVIMAEMKKRPYANMFASHFGPEEDDDQKVTCDNIATLTACLQRSVMLPLTYQLEVVNNSILTYFLVNLDMYEHLRSLKDYFFLMDGEFSKSICQNLFTRLTKTLNPQELLNFATLHNVLDKALGCSISHNHKFSENLSFTITESPLSFQHSSPDVLQCLSLTYIVNWPLNIILSQEALLRYAKVFQFLVKMRRICWVLGEDFETLKIAAKVSRQHSRKLIKSPQYVSIQIYRHVMASMVRALDNYIVTTCILSSWKELENDLKKARTLDDLYECHVVYIKKVLFRCLLNNRSTPVMKLLNDIFTVILKFSRLLKASEWHQKQHNGPFTHRSYPQLQELFHIFEKLAKYLHKVVTKMMECGYQRHLGELLTMVNLNGYYDSERSKEEQSSHLQST
ncbi:uncharacterized protein LOC113238320 [Hyposmocoma kahamanoa]|uniref:uncharacterized protein LOC113238320 n=1 Tax=Hyposmocoma kahamanoa TaxID=1477025 RepID=UPI000E6D962A|nr:uncharacterized protein LOC113238320 [Hyposmocoma kahamanoa]